MLDEWEKQKFAQSMQPYDVAISEFDEKDCVNSAV